VAEHDDTSQRTEQPTPLRLAEARRRGQVARSRDLSAVLVLLGGLMLVGAAGPRLLAGLAEMTHRLLDGAEASAGDPASVSDGLWGSVAPVLTTVGLVCGGVVAVAVAASLLQVGPLVAVERIRPDFSRLSPAEGWRRLLSLRSWVRAGLGVVRIGAVTAVAWVTVAGRLREIVAAPRLPAGRLAAEAGKLAWGLGLRIGAVMLALAGVDYLYQRWQHRQDLKITRRDLREDLRQAEGDPHVRRRRRELLRRRHARHARPADEASRTVGGRSPAASNAETTHAEQVGDG
jgi:flagellar biosynthesis protein FlhB